MRLDAIGYEFNGGLWVKKSVFSKNYVKFYRVDFTPSLIADPQFLLYPLYNFDFYLLALRDATFIGVKGDKPEVFNWFEKEMADLGWGISDDNVEFFTNVELGFIPVIPVKPTSIPRSFIGVFKRCSPGKLRNQLQNALTSYPYMPRMQLGEYSSLFAERLHSLLQYPTAFKCCFLREGFRENVKLLKKVLSFKNLSSPITPLDVANIILPSLGVSLEDRGRLPRY